MKETEGRVSAEVWEFESRIDLGWKNQGKVQNVSVNLEGVPLSDT